MTIVVTPQPHLHNLAAGFFLAGMCYAFDCATEHRRRAIEIALSDRHVTPVCAGLVTELADLYLRLNRTLLPVVSSFPRTFGGYHVATEESDE